MIKYIEEIEALISLLDDPDTSVHGPVIERLIELGEPAVKQLEHTWESTMDFFFQEKIENVILQIQQGLVKKDIKDWVDCRGDSLFYGAWLIARTQYPDLDYEHFDKKIEKIKAQIWLELNDRLTALEKIKVINHFLFTVHKFNRSLRGQQTPQLYMINHVLDTHKGLPITLAVIYAEIANRLELPVYCVDFPRNFLLCYKDQDFDDDPNGILFYINPYTRGTVLGRPELEQFLKDQKIESSPQYFKPCSNIDVITRMVDGLRYAYSASKLDDKANFQEQLLEVLKLKPEEDFE